MGARMEPAAVVSAEDFMAVIIAILEALPPKYGARALRAAKATLAQRRDARERKGTVGA